ncbi:hypothetical protein L3Q82_019606 [Scortum barcoo]|uniref:Uncharacterized protein n=1 Tax=Scortum barcoo TaxID=214431 RepID=A0ACB8VC56_9TELE|nr:hypothetical protein L3Q82_019606 [Scortum barcoo]
MFCSLPPLSTRQFEVVDARSLVPVVVAIPEPGGGHRKYRQAKQAAARRRSWRQKLGSGRSSVRPWRRTIGRPRRDSGKPSGASEGGSSTLPTLFTVQGGELLTSTEDIVGRWKKYFEDLLNPTDLPSNEEAEDGDSEVDSSITQAEVTEVVRKLLGGKAPGVDEIRPEYLKSLDVVGLSWLTRLCNIAWRLGTVPLEWQTGVVVPLFKKGDRRVCSNYRGITLLSLPGKVYARVLERRIRPIVDTSDSGGTMRFSSWSWNSGPALYPPQGAGGSPGLGTTGFHLCFLQMMLSCWLHSSQDLQHVLERFAAECEAAGMRISTSKSEAMVLDRKRVVCPLRVRWRGPASSGGVQVSRGLVHE